MKPQWQKQQEQMRQQQERMRQQQMQAAWLEQQEAKAEEPRSDAPPQERQKDRFAQVEAEVARLRQELAAGRLTEEQFKARLREMMVQDEQGTWWMVGYETGEWYRHDGNNWLPDQPPGRAVPQAAKSVRLAERPQVGWGFWFPWVLVTAIGGGVGGTVGALVNMALRIEAYGIVGWAVVGASIGIAQWFLLLLRRVRQSGWWILACAVGWAVGGPLAGPLGTLGYAVCGALTGLAQWLVLRGQVRLSGMWILASVVGWGIGGLIGWGVSAAVLEALGGFWGFAFGWIVGWTIGGAVTGAITGIPLVWLLRQPISET